MNLLVAGAIIASAISSQTKASEPAHAAIRPPAVPLVACNPYFSVWSRYDNLTDGWPTHWTGGIQAMCGLIRIDGRPYRFIGPQPSLPAGVGPVPAMKQTRLEVTATATRYAFEADGIELEVMFRSPVIASDPDLASRAVTYVTMSWHPIGENAIASHVVNIYFDCTAEWAVHEAAQKVQWTKIGIPMPEKLTGSGVRVANQTLLTSGFLCADQHHVLERVGDYTRIDWGTFFVSAVTDHKDASTSPDKPGKTYATPSVIGADVACRGQFVREGTIPTSDDDREPRAANDAWPVAAVARRVESTTEKHDSLEFLLSYDDINCVELFGKPLKPYWTKCQKAFTAMLQDMGQRRAEIHEKCDAFDRQFRAAMTRVGGEKYADLCVLAYRQVMAANVIALGADGKMVMFPKENSSNGCIGTVDVIFPACPFFLVHNPSLLEAQLRPILEYASSSRWKFPFAPHDLGTWPKANGQVYGGGEKTEENQMPVEECGNMLIMLAALVKAEDQGPDQPNPAIDLVVKHWSPIVLWADYLRDHGLDPENQLCTDDFAGHLARNANLSVKAIIAMGAFAQLCDRRGLKDGAVAYIDRAQQYVAQWTSLAMDGDHTVLAFGKPNTWSLKYNMVWDDVLGLGLFPAELKKSEIAFYRTKLNTYGVPMDNRAAYTKPEWTLWAASMSDSRETFAAFVDPIWKLANETPDRVPFTDWYETTDAKNRGMYARSVLGGMWMPVLRERARQEK